MTIIDTTANRNLSWEEVKLDESPVIVAEKDWLLPNLEPFCKEHFGLNVEQLNAILEGKFKEAFSDTIPSEYLPIIYISPVNYSRRKGSSSHELSILSGFIPKEEFLRFIEEYRSYISNSENWSDSTPETFFRALERNFHLAHLEADGSRFDFPDFRTNGLIHDIPVFASFAFTVAPKWRKGMGYVYTSDLHLEDTYGHITPLKYGERKEANLEPYDYANRFLVWMRSVVKELVPNKSIFYSVNTVTKAGMKCFGKKGGYQSQKDFRMSHPGLIEECLRTEYDGATHMYLFEK